MSLKLDYNDVKINILICHHKQYQYIKSDCLIPIQVGSDLSPDVLDYCIQDNIQDNISYKNKQWCELTAIYWQWKNVEADYYGLFHYRRYLSFNGDVGFFMEDTLDDKVIEKYGLNDVSIREKCNNYDIMTAPFDDVYSTLNRSCVMTVYEHYTLEHEKKDIDAVIGIIKNNYLQYYDSAIAILNGKKCFFGNVFVMRKEYFFEYCEFVFGVLSKFERISDIEDYDAYQARVYGFLAERLTNIYLNYVIMKNKDIRITQLGLLQICNNRNGNVDLLNNGLLCKKEKLLFGFKINICMSFDDNYFVHALTAITSLLNNTSEKNEISLYVLCNDMLNVDNRDKFSSILQGKNIFVYYCSVDDDVLKDLPLNMGYISISTYYRLLIDILLPNVDKVIYIDSDIIFLDDVAELWNIHFNNKSVGVVQDELGVTQQRRLRMDRDEVYFNAGIMVFDLKLIRNKYNDVFTKYIEIFESNFHLILFQDQDILNLLYRGDQFILPLKWNMGTGIFSKNMNETMYNLNDEFTALKESGVIHFTGGHKPWNFFANHPCSDIYWKYRIEIREIPLSFREWLNYFNHCLFKFKYIGNGSNVSFFLLNMEILKIPKNIIKKILAFRLKQKK